MENLYIEGSHDVFFVPTVDFNAQSGRCEISGESYLEDTVKFYTPLLEWLDQFIETENKPIHFNIKLTYFNTSSSRCILDILNKLKDYEDNDGEVNVTWYYNSEDVDMEEEIEDYAIDTDLDIKMITF